MCNFFAPYEPDLETLENRAFFKSLGKMEDGDSLDLYSWLSILHSTVQNLQVSLNTLPPPPKKLQN